MDNKNSFTETGNSSKTSIQKFKEIQIFQEHPGKGNYGLDENSECENIPANELFSMFTADIIKEEIIFTR